jgi:hypothetical protein
MAYKNAVLKVYFDRKGHAERIQLLASSGDKERDALCQEYCRSLTIPIPRVGNRLAGELWRRIVIKSDAVFTRS